MDFRKKSEVKLSSIRRQLQIKGVGEILIDVFTEKGQKFEFQLKDVLPVPQYKRNLISVDKIFVKRHPTLFKKENQVRKLNILTSTFH